MQLGLAIAVALLIVAVVAWPLVTRRRAGSPAGDAPDAGPPPDTAGLNEVYDAIRTLQTEHSLGRIGDADYREQLDEYRRQAALILRDMERGNAEG